MWEPPIFDHGFFEKLLEAQKKFAAKERNKDVVLTTDVTDMLVERHLSSVCSVLHVSYIEGCDASEFEFYLGLRRTFPYGIMELSSSALAKRHLRAPIDVHRVITGVMRIMDGKKFE